MLLVFDRKVDAAVAAEKVLCRVPQRALNEILKERRVEGALKGASCPLERYTTYGQVLLGLNYMLSGLLCAACRAG